MYCTVYLRASLCDEVITALGPSKSVGSFIIHSSHTPVLWPGPGQLWFPQSEATVALICSSKLYHASKVNGQKSRHCWLIRSLKESRIGWEAERASWPIDSPLSITTLAFIDWQAGGWNVLPVSGISTKCPGHFLTLSALFTAQRLSAREMM